MEKRKYRTRDEQRKLVEEWEKSCLPAREFGKRYGITKTTLWYWRSREKRSGKTEFVEVKVRDKSSSSAKARHELVLKNGRRFSFCAEADREEVCQWADALDAPC